jgi:hypothetical protein
MNDFSELENELKKLRPAPPSAGLWERIEQAIRENEGAEPEKIIRPSRFNGSWVSIGLGLAAAAAFLVFAHIRSDRTQPQPARVAQNTPAPVTTTPIAPVGYLPAAATQVTYRTRDEGLHFARGNETPMRRVRSQKRETLRWRNPETGASLQISYPSEEVVLTPVSGQ